jgi:hypothetical protein
MTAAVFDDAPCITKKFFAAFGPMQ